MAKQRDWSEAEISQAIARGDAAAATFSETLAALRTSVTSLDAIEILSRSAISMFLRIAGLDRDPKAKGMEVFHLEILQALALSAPRREARDDDNYADLTSSSIGLIERNGQAYRHLHLRRTTADADANQRHELIALLQSWTMAIRGPRHPHQTEECIDALAQAMEETFRQAFGIPPADLNAVLLGVVRTIEARMQAFLAWMKSWLFKKSGIAMIEAFVAGAHPESAAHIRKEALPHRYERDRVTAYLLHMAEDRYAALLTFDRADLLAAVQSRHADTLMALFDTLTIGFGELDDSAIEHLHLDNPVRLRPFIRLGDGRYFCCNPHSLGTNLAEIYQAICDRLPATKKRLEKERADWLERKLRAVVGQWLPSAKVFRSVDWSDAATDEAGEADVVAVIDKTVLVFEAKSGRIDGPARRGAINSLKAVLKTLVVDPSDQSRRFRDFLVRSRGTIQLSSDDGPLILDTDDLRDVIRVNVLLDVVGPLSAHWPQLRDAGLLPAGADLAPTMSIFELETIMEVLSLEIERCHYLSRRAAIERDYRYTADELDLLGFYLETQFNIGDPGPDGLWLYGRSFPIASAYGRKAATGTPRFPIKRTQLWTDLLTTIEAKRPVGWTRFGHRLLNLDLAAQKEFGRLVRHGQKAVVRSVDSFFTSAITVTVGGKRQTVAFAIGPQADSATVQSNIQYAISSAADQSGVDDPLLIYWFSPPSGLAYDIIGVFRHKALAF